MDELVTYELTIRVKLANGSNPGWIEESISQQLEANETCELIEQKIVE